MWPLSFAFIALFLHPVDASWQTVYNSNFSIVYIQSNNGSVYKLPILDYNVTGTDLENHLKEIATPPLNSSIVLDNDNHLFAIWGSHGCGSSPLEVSQYDDHANQWVSVAQSNMRTQKWYQDNQIVWLDRSTDQIYIYGGSCNGATQSAFYRFNMMNNTFEQIEAQGKIMPRQMSNAQAIPLNDYETLILGGRSGNAWMSMQQIASWGHGSWTFQSVGNSTGIDSREDPLLLPLWTYGQNGTTGIVDEILVIGGTVAGRDAVPGFAVLKYTESNGWFWTIPDQNDAIDVSFAATTLYSTLATLNAANLAFSNNPSSNNGVSLYSQGDKNIWTSVKSVAVSKPKKPQNSSSSDHSGSTAAIAVVSTLLPIVVISLAGFAVWWWLRKRRQRRLFLLPNRMSMLRRQPSTNSSLATQNWYPDAMRAPISSTNIPPQRYQEPDSGSIMMMESPEGNQLFMSKQRRNLRVVNPDNEEDQQKPSRQVSRGSQGSRDSSWSSSSRTGPFSDQAECRSEFDFDLNSKI